MALPAVGEVFKGSFDESLKKLVQPPAVIPATVFVALNVVLIYPSLSPPAKGISDWLGSLDAVWQALVLSALVLVIGYIILSLTPSILRVATGELLVGSWLGGVGLRRERDRIRRVKEQADLSTTMRAEDARWPPVESAAPTRLGNVLAGANASVVRRYGFDLAAAWTHLQIVLASDDEHLTEALDEEFAGLGVLLNLAAVILVVVAEASVLVILNPSTVLAVTVLAGVAVAYGLYRSACARARTYTDLVEAAIDLYRAKLAEKLGLKLKGDSAADRDTWDGLTAWLLWDAAPESPTDKAAPLTVAVTAPDTLVVTALPVVVSTDPLPGTPSDNSGRWSETYSFLVTAKAPEECCTGEIKTHIVLSAGKKWSLPPNPTVTINGAAGLPATRLGDGGPSGDGLLIPLTVGYGSTSDVRFTFERTRVSVAVEIADEGSATDVAVSFAPMPKLGDEVISVQLDNPGSARNVRLYVQASWMTGDAVPVQVGDREQPLNAVKPTDGDRWVAYIRDLPGGATTVWVATSDSGPETEIDAAGAGGGPGSGGPPQDDPASAAVGAATTDGAGEPET